MVLRSVLNTKVKKEASVDDKYQKNESAVNYQNEDLNDKDFSLVKYKYKMRPSETN